MRAWFINEQTGAPAFGYPAKDQRELAAECRRLTSMLMLDNIQYRKLVPEADPVASVREEFRRL